MGCELNTSLTMTSKLKLLQRGVDVLLTWLNSGSKIIWYAGKNVVYGAIMSELIDRETDLYYENRYFSKWYRWENF